MFSFLNSFVLPALAAIVIPIIIHFFNRRKTKKIQFSSLRFLKMLENQRIRQVRLLQILLILIRILFILFIVLTFARPALKSVFMQSGSARTTAVIILDDSYSMQAFNGSVSLFQKAKDQMYTILNTFNTNDRVFIIPFSNIPENLTPINLNQSLEDISKKYNITDRSPVITNVFKAANKIFQEYPNYNRELYLVSDLNISRFNLPDSVETLLKDHEVICYLVNPANNNQQNNIGIDTVWIDNQLFEVNKPVQFTIRLQNYNMDEAAETLVNLYDNNERLAMQQTVLSPAESKSVNLSFVPKSVGPVLLHFEIDDDNLLLDNHYYLNFNIPEKVNILIANDQSAPALQTALDIMHANTALYIDQLDYGQWIGKNLEKYDLIVLCNPPQLNLESVNRLNRYLQTKNILILPGLNLSIREFNLLFKGLANTDLLINLITSPGMDTYFAIEAGITKQPLFESIFAKHNNQIDLPKIFKYFKLGGSNEPIIKMQNGDALLAKYKTTQNTKLYVFTSLIEDDWNDFAYKGFFVPMFYRIFMTASQINNVDKTYRVNDNIAITLPDLSLNDDYTISSSKSDTYEVIPQQSAKGLQINLDDLQMPGHYIIQKNNRFAQAFSVNITSRELQRPYVNFENLSDNVIKADTNSDLVETIRSARIGQELWFIFLILALMMLLLEVLLIKRIEGQGINTKKIITD